MSRRKNCFPERIIGMLREAEVQLGRGARVGEVCRSLCVSEQSCCRWRRMYGGMEVNQAHRLKEPERENGRVKKAVADPTPDKPILNEALTGKYRALRVAALKSIMSSRS